MARDLFDDRTILPAVLAEMGQTPGSIDGAVALVADLARAGVWGVKVQLLTPERIASAGAEPYWRTTRHAPTQREAFALAGAPAYADFAAVRDEAHRCGLRFVASPFDLDAVAACADLGVDAIKIASGEVTHLDLLEAVADTGLPAILSTGGCTIPEVDRAVRHLSRCRQVVVLACTLAYPTDLTQAHLARIDVLRRAFPGLPVGYSDHTLGTVAAFMAGALGATLLEKHVRPWEEATACADNDMALTPGEVMTYVDRAAIGRQVAGGDGFGPVPAEYPAIRGARRSWHATKSLTPGDTIEPGMAVALRPAAPGAWQADEIVLGRRVVEPVPAGAPLLKVAVR